MSARLHWYHCSETFHGDAWIAQRRTPDLVTLTQEPQTPRLCVASSVARCFASRLFTRQVYVYRTEKPRRAVKPFDVNDAVITQERWLIPPVTMVLTGVIPADQVRNACGHGIAVIRRRMNNMEDPYLSPLDRLRSFRRVIDVLGAGFCDRIDSRFVEKDIQYFEAKGAA